MINWGQLYMKDDFDIKKTEELSPEEKVEFDVNIDRFIESLKNNRKEINDLVCQCVDIMIKTENAGKELQGKGTLQSYFGSITGSNQELQNTINLNHSTTQYLVQRILKRIAEKDLMTLDLITAVNNKLNASQSYVNDEVLDIYKGLVNSFRHNRDKITSLNKRMKNVERKGLLHDWVINIKFWKLGKTEYQYLDKVSQIVCLTRDFYEISRGFWTTSDLLLIKSAMIQIGIKPETKINFFDTLKTISENSDLKDKLFGGEDFLSIEGSSSLISMNTLKKLNDFRTTDKYAVDAVYELLRENNVASNKELIVSELTKKYMVSEAYVDVDMYIDCYDFILDLLYNLRQSCDEELATYDEHAAEVETLDVAIEHDDEKSLLQLCSQAKKYLEGIDGFSKDLKKAFELFLEASELGLAEAQYYTGKMLYDGNGICEDSERACEWLMKASVQGHAEAQCLLGQCYLSGKGIEQNKVKAVEWFHKAAEQGLPIAQYLFGAMLENGNGIQQSHEKAVEWFHKAAEQGLDIAQFYLGIKYKNGETVEKDNKKAFDLIYRAAEQGLPEAEDQLGHLYENGIGVEKDYDNAYSWYKKAYKHGYGPAKDHIRNCVQKHITECQENIQAVLDACNAFEKDIEANESAVFKFVKPSVSSSTGAAIGALIGGPAGALVGWSIGKLVE